MSVSVAYAFTATITEVLPSNTDSASSANRTVTHTNFNESGTLDATVTASPATLQASFVKELSSGSGSIDLTALTGTNGATVDGTGLQPQIVRVKNLGANSLTIKGGASNGHSAFTSTDGTVIPAGGIAMFFFNDGTQNIGSSDRIWDLTGTGAQTSEWTIVMG